MHQTPEEANEMSMMTSLRPQVCIPKHHIFFYFILLTVFFMYYLQQQWDNRTTGFKNNRMVGRQRQKGEERKEMTI